MRTALVTSLLLGFACSVGAENWPQWRGPHADGVSSDTGFPLEWSSSDNVRWKVALPGRGASTPIVWDELVFVTLQIGEGPMETRLARDLVNAAPWEDADTPPVGVHFLVSAYDREDGHVVWSYRLEAPAELPDVYPSHNLASPSVATDGELVLAWFGTGQLVALDLEGRRRWSKDIGAEYFPFRLTRGHATSPVLWRDSVILLVDHEDEAMLLSLDTKTGEERFKIDRGDSRRSYATPLIVDHGGRAQIIVNGEAGLDAYEPDVGTHLWHVAERVRLSAPTPVSHGGNIYVNRGYSSSPYMALSADGELRWRSATGGPYVSSPLVAHGRIYMATEHGIVSVIDADTGERLTRFRTGDVYTASPVAADGHVFLVGESGVTVVVSEGAEPEVRSRNPLEERVIASPALSDGQIFIRGDRHLFAIGR